MNRIQIVLTSLIVVLLAAIFWFLVHTPQQEELADLEASIEAQESQQATLRAQIESLREVRSTAPELESALATASAIIPRDAAQPSAIRQLQQAADESGLTLRTISGQRPTVLDADLGLSNISLSIQLEGTYFQAVDFLRRIEDPSITARGILWSSVNVTRTEYPQLNVLLSGDMFTLAPPQEEPAEVDDPAADADGLTDDDGEPIDEVDADLEQEDEQ